MLPKLIENTSKKLIGHITIFQGQNYCVVYFCAAKIGTLIVKMWNYLN